MKILYYCQHVLGIGHFFRSLEICKSLAGQEVILATGGSMMQMAEMALPPHVREVRLPALMMDEGFSRLFAAEEGKSLALAQKERQALLWRLFESEAPDMFILELYPFGRKAFHFELDPVLEGIRSGKLPPTPVICSLRDVLVEKRDAASYEARVVAMLNRYFSALLIHADPRLLTLDETFSRVKDITIPIAYTGFVSPRPAPQDGERLRKKLGIDGKDLLVVASAGGGVVGRLLMESVIAAFELLETRRPRHLYLFTGPFMKEEDFIRLKDLAKTGDRTEGGGQRTEDGGRRTEEDFIRLKGPANGQIHVCRFTGDFLSYLAAADLSVSMAGYNTCMNILASGVQALVWPFSQNREQSLRAHRLAGLGALRLLSDEDLEPRRLAGLMEEAMLSPRRAGANVDLDGAGFSARWLLRNATALRRQ